MEFEFEIYPYFHPTTTVFIDDDEVFLSALIGALGVQNHIVFTQTNKALVAINTPPENVFLNCRKLASSMDFSVPLGSMVWDLSKIIDQCLNPKRTDEISVAVVDYEMPEMSGIDFCRRIQNNRVKKIILTGHLSQQKGSDALSVNKINSYVQKSNKHFMMQLEHYIAFNQAQYFADIKQKFIDAKVGLPEFMNDSEFSEYFTRLYERYDITEYYLTQEPDGLLMIGANGRDYYHLLVYTEAQLKSQWEVASEQGADANFLNKLSKQEVVPDFYADTQGYYSPIYAAMLDLYTFKAKLVNTQKGRYFCHLRRQPPAYQELLQGKQKFYC
jgi:CheY-like chemotaxis protein